jgi:hypothetical protein
MRKKPEKFARKISAPNRPGNPQSMPIMDHDVSWGTAISDNDSQQRQVTVMVPA